MLKQGSLSLLYNVLLQNTQFKTKNRKNRKTRN